MSVTTEEAAAARAAAADQNGQGQEAQQPTTEELQQRLEEAEQRAKSAEGRLRAERRSSAISGEAIADMEERMRTSTLRAIREAFETDDPVERNRRLGEIEAEQKQQSALAKRITDAQPRLDRLVEDSGKDFSDPMFSEAQTAWDNGRPEEAIALARIAVTEARTGNTFTKEEVDEMIEAKLKNARVSTPVDTGSSTSAAASEKPSTRAELARYLASRRAAGNPVPASEHASLIAGVQD